MLYAIIGVLAALVVSCSSDSTDDKFNSASGTIEQSTVSSNKATFVSTTKFTTNGTPSGLPSTGTSSRGERASTFDNCVTKDPSTPTDTDGDGIKSQTMTFNCNLSSQGFNYVQNGTYKVADKDDNDNKSGWRYDVDMTGTFKADSGSHDFSYKYNGFWEMTIGSTTHTYASNYKGSYTGKEHNETMDTTAGGNWTYTITPTTMSTPYTAGTAEFSGYFGMAFSGKAYVFKSSGTGLTYSSSCSHFYTAGTLTYTDGGGNVITVDYGDSTCSEPTVKFNGTVL